jgi:signal peptidase I
MSMSPALMPGDRLLARKLRAPKRGRIVFFPHPHRDDFWLVKRIVGLPGDAVRWVDGEPVIETGSEAPDAALVPPGYMYVLSDRRDLTRADSRTFGPVPMNPAYIAVFRYRRGDR